MKIDVGCGACGKRYLVDSESLTDAGGQVSCPACGATIEIPGTASAMRAPAPPPAAEVHCPRCGLHFVPATRRDVSTSAARQTVLVVEDMDYFFEIVKDALSGGYEVTHARTVAEAVASVKAAAPDMMLLDLMLAAGEDGLAVLREFPERPFPVLVVTAQDEAEMYGEEWQRLSALGVNDVVRKGMNMSEMLLRKVAAALGRADPQGTLRD